MLKNWAIEEFSCPETDQVTLNTSWLPTIGNGLNEQNWRGLLPIIRRRWDDIGWTEYICEESSDHTGWWCHIYHSTEQYTIRSKHNARKLARNLKAYKCISVILNKLIVREVFVLPRYNLIAKLWHTLLLPWPLSFFFIIRRSSLVWSTKPTIAVWIWESRLWLVYVITVFYLSHSHRITRLFWWAHLTGPLTVYPLSQICSDIWTVSRNVRNRQEIIKSALLAGKCCGFTSRSL